MRFLSRLGLVPFVLLAGCSSHSPSNSNPAPDASFADASPGDDSVDAAPAGDASDTGAPIDAAAIVAARPYTLHVPPSYDAGSPAPLVVMFHGYSGSGSVEEQLFKIAPTSDAHGFLYAYGDGLVDSSGNRFWNATDACCNIDHNPVDDVAYFDAIVDDVSSKYAVDPHRIYAIGHSNGGFMAHRLACDRTSKLAAIVSYGGAVWNDATKCNPSAPIAVAEVHGDADQTISYDGGQTVNGTYPSAHQTVATWAAKNGCTGTLASTGATLDVALEIPGNETVVAAYGGCPSGVDVQLWTVQGGPHIPTFSHPAWGEEVWAFLSTHTR